MLNADLEMLSKIIIYFLFCFVCGETARILAVLPTPSISHQVVFRPLMHELARRGHEVIVITPDPAFPKGKAPANLTEIDVHDSYKTWAEFLSTSTGKKNDIYNQFKTALDLFIIIMEQQILNDEVQKIIQDKNNTFDLIFTEACVRPALMFSHIYKAPVIQISSLGIVFTDLYDIVGAPTHPLLYPTVSHQKLYNLTMWEKIYELYNHYKIDTLVYEHANEENELIKKLFGDNAPTVKELVNNVQMLFLNVNPIWEGNHPVPPAVVYMGGLHQKPEKDLPKDLKSFLDASKQGVIYMSFGTNTNPSSLPPEKIQMFIRVFSQLPYDILWKWDKDEMPGRTKNIRIGKWFPQSDLLRHPKIKLFITQCGLQSSDEAITAGVPLIGIPMLGDQWYNGEKYVHHGIGQRLDLESLTEEIFRDAITNVINDQSYKNNIIQLRSLMNDQPMSALDRAVWWTEYVLRHGGAKHLRAPAANISWAQYYEIELLAVVLSVIFIIFTLFLSAIIILRNYVSLPRFKLKHQ